MECISRKPRRYNLTTFTKIEEEFGTFLAWDPNRYLRRCGFEKKLRAEAGARNVKLRPHGGLSSFFVRQAPRVEIGKAREMMDRYAHTAYVSMQYAK